MSMLPPLRMTPTFAAGEKFGPLLDRGDADRARPLAQRLLDFEQQRNGVLDRAFMYDENVVYKVSA